MAKKPTPAPTAGATVPSQPWAQPAASASENPAPAEASEAVLPAPADETQNPAALGDDDAIRAMLEGLDEAETAEFQAFMTAKAKAKLEQLVRSRVSRAMEVNLVDGNDHYGKRITTAAIVAADETEA